MAIKKRPIEIVEEGKHPLLVKCDRWDRVFIKDICKVQNGYAFSSKNFTKNLGLPLIRIRDIDKAETENKYNGEYNEEYVVNKGEIIVGMDGDFRVARWKGDKALLNQRVCKIIPNSNKFSEKFLFICLQPYLNAIHEETSSVTVKHLSSKTIEEIPLPFPSLLEQEQIVSKIEEVFSELDKSIEQLRTTQQQLKVYRQSVLKWAFEGKLTNDNVKEGELPDEWRQIRIEEVATTFGGYAFKSGDFIDKGRFQVLRMGNVRPGLIRGNESPVFLNDVEEKILEKSLLEYNDVIITLTGTRKKRDYGYTAIVAQSNYLLNQRIAALRFNESYLSKFFLYYSWTDYFKDQFFANETGNVGQGNVGMKAITKTQIPFPPKAVQERVVEEIESRLSVADKLEETIINSLQQAEVSKRSILKKAFEGNL